MNKFHSTLFVFLLISIFFTNGLTAQWEEDFTDSNLSSWSGDVGDFIINDDGQLQLNALEAGESTIFVSKSILADTISFGFYHKMDFSPSDNNQSTIYIGIDNQDLMVAKGYFMRIGENGSDDAIKFYYLDNGTEELIGSATMGAMANDPAEVRIQIDIYPNGLWSVSTNYEGQSDKSLDLEFMDDRTDIKDSFLGLSCKYSASRTDKFFYDDFFLLRFEVDKTPPTVTAAQIIGPSALLIQFNESVEVSDATNVSNYTLDNGLGNPSTISPQGSNGTEYVLTFSQNFEESIDYTLTVENIKDLNDNTIATYSFEFNVPSKPEVGDLLLSEILFDPYTDGEDFVEIYNASDKFIDLRSVKIRNNQNEQEQSISEEIILAPKSYIAFSEDVSYLLQEYKPAPEAIIEFNELPAFNNGEGNVMIINADGSVLDSFDYTEDLHFTLIEDTEGVSLERVNFTIDANNNNNWQSASQNVRFATPGYANSANVTIDPSSDVISISTETFSPNQDGNDDLMILNYNLDKSGYLLTVAIHDAAGFKVRELTQNELLSTQGIITWDGTNTEGNISDLGIYIVVGSLFHQDGEVINFRKTTVLADFID